MATAAPGAFARSVAAASTRAAGIETRVPEPLEAPDEPPVAALRRRFERHPRPVGLDEDPGAAGGRGRRSDRTGRGGTRTGHRKAQDEDESESSLDLRQERARGVEAPERTHSVPAVILSRHERDARRREDPLPVRPLGVAERERLVGKDEKLRRRAPRAAPRPSSARGRPPPERRSRLRTSRGDRRCRSPPRRPSTAPSRSGRRTGPAGPPGPPASFSSTARAHPSATSPVPVSSPRRRSSGGTSATRVGWLTSTR